MEAPCSVSVYSMPNASTVNFTSIEFVFNLSIFNYGLIMRLKIQGCQVGLVCCVCVCVCL